MKKWLIANSLWFMVMFLSGRAEAQGVSFKAQVDKNTVALDDQVELTLIVTGSQDTESPKLPKMDGFVVSSRGSSSQFSFVNGKINASTSFSYALMPLNEGKQIIPPIEIVVDGQSLKTEPIEIEIVKSGAAPPAAQGKAGAPPAPQQPQGQDGNPMPEAPLGPKDRIFIELTVDKENAYIGEQITMTFKLYCSNAALDNVQYLPPVTKNFVAESMGNQKEYQEVRKGVTYNVIELKTAIFPAAAGELTVEPAKLKCELLVAEQKQRRRMGGAVDDFFDNFVDDSFFNNYLKYPVDLQSEPIKIFIRQLPAENKPASFGGAVGAYDLSVFASPQTLKAGDPVNLVMKVSGVGNITQVNEPILKDMTGFKGYDPEVRTEIKGRNPQIAGEKVFQKIIIPQGERVKNIPAIEFSYFDTKLNQYKTITKGPFPLTVEAGEKKETSIVELIKENVPDEEAKKALQILAKDIHYIETAPGSFIKAGVSWYSRIWLWIILIFAPVCLITFLFIYKAHKTKLLIDTAYAKKRSAGKEAKLSLNEAVKYQRQNKPKEFYDAVAKTVQKLIGDKMNMPIGAVTVDLLAPKGIETSSIKKLLETADMVRFGAHTATQQEMKQVIKEVENVIGLLSKKL